MSAQPEVAITIMTGGHTAAAGTSATEGAGPVPAPLDQLAATATGTQTGDQGAPTPDDLDELAESAKPAKKAAAKKSSRKRGE